MHSEWDLKRRLVVQNLKMAWNKRFIPKLFVWHSSRDIVRKKWRYYRAGLYTEMKRSHWLKQWPIRKGLGDKKRRVVIGWRCNLDLVEMLERSTNGKFKRFRRSSRSKRILFVCREEDSEICWKSLPGQRDEMKCELERGQRICPYCKCKAHWALSRRCWPMADSWNCWGLVSLQGWGRLWRMCGVGGLVIDFGMCCLICSSKRWDVRPTYRLSQWHTNW